MVLETKPMMHWSEPPLVLSPTETFKAAALGDIIFGQPSLVEVWRRSRTDPILRADLHDAAACGLHRLLSKVKFEDFYDDPSPFIIDDAF